MERRILRSMLLACATGFLLFFSGCAGHIIKPSVPDLIDGKVGRYAIADYKADLARYSNADGAEAMKVRNKMVYGILAEIDFVFFDYETNLFVNEGRFRVGADFMELGLAAGSTITNGARAKTVLSAVLTGVTGLNLSVDKNFFRQQTAQAIMSSMEANRDRIKTVILQQMGQDTTTYPFAAARSDLIKYFFAGTLAGGLQQINQQAATEAETQKAKLNKEQVKGISEEDVKSSISVHQAVAEAFKNNDLSKVKAWLKEMGETFEDNAGKDKLDPLIRDLGDKAATDEALRKKYFEAAKKVGLIK